MKSYKEINAEFRIDPDFEGRAWAATSLEINGSPMHLYALRVVAEDGIQVAYDLLFEREVMALQDISDSPLRAVPLEGLEGEWIVCCMPHGV